MMIQSVLDEVLANHFRAVADEMSYRVLRAAHTTFVKETQDYATALITVKGEAFAYPYKTGVTSLMGIPVSAGIEAFDDWQPGDVMITNDPYATRGMVMHLPDLHLLKPIFHDGKLICFAWTFMHCTDVGGLVAGSSDPNAYEAYQEGFRLRPVKLFRQGVRNEDVWNFIADNSRIPDLNAGDLEALLSAIACGEKRIIQLIERYGQDALLQSIYRILDGTEQRTRAVLKQIPKGDYNFVDYLDDDYVSDIPVHIEVTLRSDGEGKVVLDYHGSDPQVRASLNLPTGGQKHHPFLSLAIVNYITTNSESLHFNAGIIRCVELDLPEASVVNSSFPAACALRYLSAMRAHDAVLGALAKAGVDVPAAGGGGLGITMLTVRSLEDGKMHVAVGNPIIGGTGGGPKADGVAGVDYPNAFLRNVPAEIMETEVPVIIRRFGTLPDSEGAGRLRGGMGIVYEVEALHPDSMITARSKERYRFAPWGVGGGQAGTVGRSSIRHADGSVSEMGKQSHHRAAVGDTLVMHGPGGGGFGEPLERKPEHVLDDVLDGFVSTRRAQDIYGVVIQDGAIDAAATQALRKERGSRAADPASVDRGETFNVWNAEHGAAAEEISKWLVRFVPRLRPLAREHAFASYAKLRSAPDAPVRLREMMAKIETQLTTARHH